MPEYESFADRSVLSDDAGSSLYLFTFEHGVWHAWWGRIPTGNPTTRNGSQEAGKNQTNDIRKIEFRMDGDTKKAELDRADFAPVVYQMVDRIFRKGHFQTLEIELCVVRPVAIYRVSRVSREASKEQILPFFLTTDYQPQKYREYFGPDLKDRFDYDRYAHRIIHRVTPLKVEFSPPEILFRTNTDLRTYLRGDLCGCFPILGTRDALVFRRVTLDEITAMPTPEKTEWRTCMVSRMDKILERLNGIWQDDSVNNIMILGPPGSGKELFCNLIRAGKAHSYESQKDKTPSISSVMEDVQEFERMIFGHCVSGVVSPGLLKRAEGGSIFFDEIGKTRAEVRATLLRVMESREFYPVGGGDSFKLGNTLLIFASTPHDRKGSGKEPLDFWTRLTELEITNPLSRRIFVRPGGYFQNLFLHFWWMGVEKILDASVASPLAGWEQIARPMFDRWVGKVTGEKPICYEYGTEHTQGGLIHHIRRWRPRKRNFREVRNDVYEIVSGILCVGDAQRRREFQRNVFQRSRDRI